MNKRDASDLLFGGQGTILPQPESKENNTLDIAPAKKKRKTLPPRACKIVESVPLLLNNRTNSMKVGNRGPSKLLSENSESIRGSLLLSFFECTQDDLLQASDSSSTKPGLGTSPPAPTPCDLWKKAFESFLVQHEFLGSMLIRGVQNFSGHSNKESPGEDVQASHMAFLPEIDTRQLTRQDLQELRYILITPSRAEKLEYVQESLFQDNPDRTYDQHGTFSRHVFDVWDYWNCYILKNCRVQSDRLDWLIAFTSSLHEWDAWIDDDPECDHGDLAKMIKSVSGAWQRLLLRERDFDGVDLGWDDEFTRPGVMELLRVFKAKVEECPALGSFDFAI